MRIWIDADTAIGRPTFFGLTPLERILRAVARLGNAVTDVTVSASQAVDVPKGTTLDVTDAPAGTRLARYQAAHPGPVLAIDGAALIDNRLLPLLVDRTEPVAIQTSDPAWPTAILRLDGQTPPSDAATLTDAAQSLIADGTLAPLPLGTLPAFVTKLRREVPFTLQAMPDTAARDALERDQFWRNYKGSTDFLTRWVFPPFVWPATRFCARNRIHPNTVTIASIVLCIAAIPLFAAGMWVTGLIAAYAMMILDSVDGKLARLTMTDSKIGDVLDHGTDIVHPPFWYIAWAIGLGATSFDHPLATAALWLFAFYIGDRLVLMVAKWHFGRGLHAVTDFDGSVRTWIARRNVNVAIFTLGLALGLGAGAFVAVTIWQGVTMAWHAARTAWLWPASRHAAPAD
ncbi:MAG: CDP-alcohol phosphatidyltransferase family protein [Pseudomonadota bacterium]